MDYQIFMDRLNQVEFKVNDRPLVWDVNNAFENFFFAEIQANQLFHKKLSYRDCNYSLKVPRTPSAFTELHPLRNGLVEFCQTDLTAKWKFQLYRGRRGFCINGHAWRNFVASHNLRADDTITFFSANGHFFVKIRG